MSERRVLVGDKYYEVSVDQTSKTVWRAGVEFYGRNLEVKGRSATQALAHWRRAANAQYQRQ